jgi:hypothetical protein
MNEIILAPCDVISKIKQNSSDMNEIYWRPAMQVMYKVVLVYNIRQLEILGRQNLDDIFNDLYTAIVDIPLLQSLRLWTPIILL